MAKFTVIWGDEDEGMIPHLYHAEFEGAAFDAKSILLLLYEAMASEMDEEVFSLTAQQMTSQVIAVLPGHVEPTYLWDGTDLPAPVRVSN